MSTSPISPRLIKGGIVTMDPDTAVVQSVIALQYNPDSLTRTLQIQSLPGGQDGVRTDALRPTCATRRRWSSGCSRNWRNWRCW